jgi:hypothetical protein
MADPTQELTRWNGRDLFDANARKIGVIAGPGYARRRFGTGWLLVEMDPARLVMVPADQIVVRGERLVLPYPRTYVECAPTVERDSSPTPADERRLRLHYGIEGGAPNAGCQAGCGLCMARKRAERRQQAG